jgi:hypothetical protein
MTRGSKVFLSVIVGFFAGLYAIGSAEEIVVTARGVVNMTDPFEVSRAMSDPTFRQALRWGPLSLEGRGWAIIVPLLFSILGGLVAYIGFGASRKNGSSPGFSQDGVYAVKVRSLFSFVGNRWRAMTEGRQSRFALLKREVAIFLIMLAAGLVLAFLAGSFGLLESSVTSYHPRTGTSVTTSLDDGKLTGVVWGPYLLSIVFRLLRRGAQLFRD